MADLAGFGREEYGSGPYGQAVPVSVTGVAGTGALGTVTPTGTAVFAVTGVAGTGGIGTVTPAAGAGVALTGVAATGGIGGVNVWGIIDASQTPNWVEIAA